MDSTAIVILNYNGVELLKQFLPAIIKHSGNCQVAVIDNHSSDDSVSFLKNYLQVQLIKLEDNYGFSGGYNKGLEFVKAENFILLNSDVEVTMGWAEQLIDFMQSQDEIAICQPKILSYLDQQRFDYAGAAGGYLDLLGYPYCRGRIFDTLEKDQGQYDDNREIFWAGGACFFIRAKVFNQLGGFDQDFFAHMEEIDLCWRAKRSGYKIAYVGSSTVHHLGGGTLSGRDPFKTYLNFRNGLQLLFKNSSLAALVWKLPLRICLDLIASLRFLFQGNWAHCRSVIKAELMFLWEIPKIWTKRRQFKAPFGTKLSKIILVLEYFIKRKRKFQDL